MKTTYHRAITSQALSEYFSPAALEMVIAGNLYQDRLRGQIGHDEYHFDQNAFAKGWAYIEENRALVRPALDAGNSLPARRALGRLTHAAQDLYAHSNYVSLWLTRFPDGHKPAAGEIDPFDGDLLHSPDLHSGKVYWPIEPLTWIPVIGKIFIPLLPRDSHAWMNLDTPERGALFAYAFSAAVKRTRFEYERTVNGLPPELLSLFCN
jgi:hypothetical protein